MGGFRNGTLKTNTFRHPDSSRAGEIAGNVQDVTCRGVEGWRGVKAASDNATRTTLLMFKKNVSPLDLRKHSTQSDWGLFCVLCCGLFTLENSFNLVHWRGNITINTNQ